MKSLLTIALTVYSAVGLALEPNTPSILDELISEPEVQETTPVVCASFAGKWEGTCVTSEGKQFPEKFEVVQKGCGFIRFQPIAPPAPADNEAGCCGKSVNLFVGAMVGSTGSIAGCGKPNNEESCSSGATFSHGVETHWNKDYSAVTVHATGFGKKMGLNTAPRGFHAKKEMKLVDGKLFIESALMGGKPGPHHVKLCTLSKLAN